MLAGSSVVFLCTLLLRQLTVLHKPSRSLWKTTSRQQKASWGRCSSERSTPGWRTTAFQEPPPASCAAVKTRSGGKRMRSGQVTREKNPNKNTSFKNQKTFYRLLVSTTKTNNPRASSIFHTMCNCLQFVLFLSLPLHTYRCFRGFGVKVSHANPEVSQELLRSADEMENCVTDRHVERVLAVEDK